MPKPEYEEIVPYPSADADQNLQRTIMIAVDEEKHSHFAVHWTICNIINPKTDRIILLNVRPTVGVGLSLISSAEFLKRYEDVIKSKSIELLNSVHDKFKGCMVRSISTTGDPKELIVQLVEEFNVDILVVGSRGISGLKRTFAGSVSDYCMHYANCAVMIPKSENIPELSKLEEKGKGVLSKEE